MSDQLGLVLDEIRGCRADIADMKVEQERRLTKLEVHDTEIYGNGQPGWKTDHGDRITRLETRATLVIGGAVAVGAIFHFVVDHFFK